MSRWDAQYPSTRWHWEGCDCEDCTRIHEIHNHTNWCTCQGCQTRNMVWSRDKIIEKGNSTVSTVNFCERCESMGKSTAMGVIQYRTDPSQPSEQKEICPGCVGEFMDWLVDPLMGTRERAYKQPWTPDTIEPETAGDVATNQIIRAIAAAVAAADKEERKDDNS